MLALLLAAAAALAPLSDSDKLKIREAQMARLALDSRLALVEAQYPQLKAAADKARAAEQAALDAAARQCQCVIDPQTLQTTAHASADTKPKP